MVEEPLKFGNPWTILPIKNVKYAKDLIDVHLSDRDLDFLEKFEDFPNLEVVWLNNNKLKNLDGLNSNFRIKKIYCQNNSLNNIEAIKKFKFLDTLLIGDNRIRNLDKFIPFLQNQSQCQNADL